jgi:hypothetical protein
LEVITFCLFSKCLGNPAKAVRVMIFDHPILP